jgi:hypothetical protein
LSTKGKNKQTNLSTELTTKVIQDGTQANAEELIGATTTQGTKQQLHGLIMSDPTLISNIAESVAQHILDSSNLINKIATILVSSDDFISSVTSKLTAEIQSKVDSQIQLQIEPITQKVFESVSLDLDRVSAKAADVEANNNKLLDHIDLLETKLDEQEQYSRRNCLLIHGIPETSSKENTDTLVIDTIRERLNISITEEDLDRTHRLGPKRKLPPPEEEDDNTDSASYPRNHLRPRPRPIIIKFARYATRNVVFCAKSGLKSTGIVISENLTLRRVNLLKNANAHPDVESAWSIDGKIQLISKKNKYTIINTINDLDKL